MNLHQDFEKDPTSLYYGGSSADADEPRVTKSSDGNVDTSTEPSWQAISSSEHLFNAFFERLSGSVQKMYNGYSGVIGRFSVVNELTCRLSEDVSAELSESEIQKEEALESFKNLRLIIQYRRLCLTVFYLITCDSQFQRRIFSP